MTLRIIMTVFGHHSNVIRTLEEFHEAIKYGYKVSLHHSRMMCRVRALTFACAVHTRDPASYPEQSNKEIIEKLSS